MAKRETDGGIDWPGPRELAGELAVLAIIALILAAAGPFGSFVLGDFWDRLAYWGPAAFLGFMIFRPIALVVLHAAGRMGVGEFPAMLIATVIAAFPASAAMLWLGGVRFGHVLRIDDLLQLYFQVALIGAVIGAVFVLTSRGKPERDAADVEEQLPPAPAFFERLPGHWNRCLTALEMEDHYVRAHGPAGQSILILMRMADAERELAGADGARVHRSWWVSRDAVTGKRRDGRNLVLQLGGGLEAPVARDRLADLRAAGWPL